MINQKYNFNLKHWINQLFVYKKDDRWNLLSYEVKKVKVHFTNHVPTAFDLMKKAAFGLKYDSYVI